MTGPVCDQCGTRTPHLVTHSDHGNLCATCAYRQENHEHGDH